MTDPIQAVREATEAYRDDIIQFLKDICAIPSMESQLRDVGERIAEEMNRLGFDEVRWDSMGNILGRMGDGPRKILFDSHVDTVGIGDPEAWDWDPFVGKVEDGIFYARGACDEKGSTPPMIYACAIARDLGLMNDCTLYYYGNMEEWCDGIAPHSLVETDGIRPDFVVIGEPTRMQVYRGHKGRVEMEVVSKGKSAHAASNHLGDNAIYKMLPVIAGIRDLEPSLGDDPFLGPGKITVSDQTVKTPSINAVPDECTILIDRRVTFGETKEEAVAQVEALVPEEHRDQVKVSMLHYDEPSYTGFVFPVEKYFPAWSLPEDHPLVRSGLEVIKKLWDREGAAGKWNFSTNGIYWMGKANIPSIGFGPGDEEHAHTVLDQVSLDDVVDATAFYALLPSTLGLHL
ncbi:MAG: YgeY family selenium metabolism-linked hydrolase [Planctomycetota bacterium]|jgi:putative selenium metabolism hydrolase|nr:YgeY family selenium metabolism-linked hydrolase [Planctomycetota bacterium]